MSSATHPHGNIAHGMNGSLVAPDWVPLTLEEVRSVLREYSLDGDDVHLLSISPRPFSAASVIATEAFDMAADPTAFPEQVTPPKDHAVTGNLTEGLRPWQPHQTPLQSITSASPPHVARGQADVACRRSKSEGIPRSTQST